MRRSDERRCYYGVVCRVMRECVIVRYEGMCYGKNVLSCEDVCC